MVCDAAVPPFKSAEDGFIFANERIGTSGIVFLVMDLQPRFFEFTPAFLWYLIGYHGS